MFLNSLKQMINFPIIINIFGIPIYLHFIMEFLGIFIGIRYYWYLKKQKKETWHSITSLTVVIGATFGAFFGSHILGALENYPEWFSNDNKLNYFINNKTLVGGVIGGLIGVELCKKIINEKKSTGDLFVFPLILAICIGRIGCFSTGIYEETYGLPTSLPWGMYLGDENKRHPVTLYEILFLIIVWLFLKKIHHKYILQSGDLFKMFMIFYLIFRFFLDFIKPGLRYYLGLGTIQIACLLTLIYYSNFILKLPFTKKLNIK